MRTRFRRHVSQVNCHVCGQVFQGPAVAVVNESITHLLAHLEEPLELSRLRYESLLREDKHHRDDIRALQHRLDHVETRLVE